MPEIVRFYGIVIKMFFSDHAPPHIHAVYGEYNAVFDIQALSMIEGDLPNRAQKLVLEWLANYQKDVLMMWNEQKTNKLPPLK
jgi:Domain of unknown function (DUF4160)